MAHYAFLDENNLVTEVITGVDENNLDTLPQEFTNWEEFYSNFRGQTCKRTSYNTVANTHTGDGTPFRGNYAGIGFTYDTVNDVFYPPQPYGSWTLNSNWVWEAPVAYPNDGEFYTWNENTQSWDLQE